MRSVAAWLKHWWIAVAAGALGIAVLAASWVVPDRLNGDAGTWWEAVLTNVGAAILLIAPIAWASERLTRQVEIVREDVEASRVATDAVREDVRRVREETTQEVEGLRQEVASLRDLSDSLRARRDAEMQRETGAYRRLGLDGTVPAREDVIEALRLAIENGVVEQRYGPRAALGPGRSDYLRLRYEPNDFGESDLFFEVMSVEGWVKRFVAWDEGGLIQDVLFGVTKALRQEGLESSLDASDWFRRLSQTLVIGASHSSLHKIVELHEPQWAVTRDGVTAYEGERWSLGPDQFDYHEVMESVMKEAWVDPRALGDAIATWKALFAKPSLWGTEPPF